MKLSVVKRNVQCALDPSRNDADVDQLTPSQEQMRIAIHKMARKQVQIEVDFQMMKRQFKKFEGLLRYQETIVNQDVIIIGGWYDFENASPFNTVEKYNIVEKRSTMLPQLNHPRGGSASCVYNNDILVVGGFDGTEAEHTIEVLKMNQYPLRWEMFDGKLPVTLSCHDVIVYQGKLYTIGGHNGNEKKSSNAVYEIALTPPYTSKLLTRMPEAREDHRAELVNEKLFILGGTTTDCIEDVTDSVVVYNFIKNEFKPCPSLPWPVSRMSTVTWRNKIIVIGGMDENDKPLNDVIMYDTVTGKSKPLPSMIYRRSGSSAVIMNDVIVVFGGWNKEQRYLNSVESFTIGGNAWKELPGMIEKRCNATAVVKHYI
ncbi:kelch-like protein 20 isoform X2 [Dendronephthya gigantea]|uniref:kelch-like protein 20 isoform X2 n=1 Tax=Dendronephthya gigantea TaxID=151771 RepID=UPI00106C8D3F|nr:kelch-like protein 20 isoform X2 [Dendronephthya gigantea]